MINLGFETLTVSNTAAGPTTATYSKAGTSYGQANYALFGPLETAQIRWRDDGTAPDASTGHLLEIGQVLEYDGDLAKISFIRTGGTSGVLPASYYVRSSRA